MPILSLIIPVYRVEKYIARFSHSVFQQTMKDIEYIFVDDASPDKSIDILRDILEQYPDRKPHVHILRHETNRGVVEARKSGLLAATGEYIAHVDSDDWLERDYCEKLYTFANTGGGYDLVWCDYYRDDAQSTYCSMAHSTDKISLMKDMISGSLPSFLVLRLAKRSSYGKFENFVFPSGAMTDDLVYSIQLTNNSNNIGYLPKSLYHYCCNPTSITVEDNDEAVIKKFHQMVLNTNLLPKLLGDYYTAPDWQPYIESKKMLCKDYLCLGSMPRAAQYLYRNTYPEVNSVFIFSKLISWRVKLRAICLLLRLNFVYRIIIWIRRNVHN